MGPVQLPQCVWNHRRKSSGRSHAADVGTLVDTWKKFTEFVNFKLTKFYFIPTRALCLHHLCSSAHVAFLWYVWNVLKNLFRLCTPDGEPNRSLTFCFSSEGLLENIYIFSAILHMCQLHFSWIEGADKILCLSEATPQSYTSTSMACINVCSQGQKAMQLFELRN